jgi:hypothetical protein
MLMAITLLPGSALAQDQSAGAFSNRREDQDT